MAHLTAVFHETTASLRRVGPRFASSATSTFNATWHPALFHRGPSAPDTSSGTCCKVTTLATESDARPYPVGTLATVEYASSPVLASCPAQRPVTADPP